MPRNSLTAIVLLASSNLSTTNGFAAPSLGILSSFSSSSSSTLAPPSLTSLLSTASPTTPSAPTDESDTPEDHSNKVKSPNGETWWNNFELEDSALPLTVKDDFPILGTTFDKDGKLLEDNYEGNEDSAKRLIYLDSAATSQKPLPVTSTLTNYYQKLNSNVHRGAHYLSRAATEEYEAARDKVTKFINANSRNEVVFTRGATEAINLVASSLSHTCGRDPTTIDGSAKELYLQEGDELIITEAEHHSNIVPWQMAAKRSGATLKFIPTPNSGDGSFDLDAFLNLVTSNTKFVSVQHVSNVLGSINPIDDIVKIVRTQAAPGAKIMLDACQSIPHMPVDVQSLGVDFIAASGHKMCGPTGIGFLWGKESALNSLAPYMGGGEMIDQVYMDHSTYALAPARFEAGTPPIGEAIGLGAAVDYLQGLGMERIHNYELELGTYLRKRLGGVEGVTVLGPAEGEERAALCAFVTDCVHPSDLGTFLDVEGVAIRAGHHCCQPLHRALGYSHSARASLYFYNTKEDVDRFIEVLEETLRFFRGLEGGADSESVNGNGGDDDFVPLF